MEPIPKNKDIESYKISCKYCTITPGEEIKSDSDSDYDIIICNRFETKPEEEEDWEIINQEIIYQKNPEDDDDDIKDDCDISRLEWYDPFKERPELFVTDKPIDLPPIRLPYKVMQHYIPIMRYPMSYPDKMKARELMTWQGRKIPTYNKATDEVADKIRKELKSGRIEHTNARSTILMFVK